MNYSLICLSNTVGAALFASSIEREEAAKHKPSVDVAWVTLLQDICIRVKALLHFWICQVLKKQQKVRRPSSSGSTGLWRRIEPTSREAARVAYDMHQKLASMYLMLASVMSAHYYNVRLLKFWM
ncbi:hypothetical protein DVH05_004731 [Phytophthora capsici]|nr:hypothetical protein DVH05_004731 [Phytophthora capsici]